MIVQDSQCYEDPAPKSVGQHLSQYLAVVLRHARQQDVDAALIRKGIQHGVSVGVPYPGPGPAGTDLALALATLPDELVDQGPVQLVFSIYHTSSMAVAGSPL